VNRDTEEFAEPMDLPEGVQHCGSTAYGLGCRCRYCVKWRRMYDQITYWKQAPRRRTRSEAALRYLAHRGVAVTHGPFKKRPGVLAQLVANYFYDDLRVWVVPEEEEEGT